MDYIGQTELRKKQQKVRKKELYTGNKWYIYYNYNHKS